MPKDSCIPHQQTYYIEFRRDYVDMFDGDHCAAVLMGLFEFLTNGELTRFRMANESGEPWFKSTMPAICEETLGLYSIRSLQERIDFMEKCGLLTVSRKSMNAPACYLLRYAEVAEALRIRRVFKKDPIGNFAEQEKESRSAAASAITTSLLPIGGGVLNLKEEELRTDHGTAHFPNEENIPAEDHFRLWCNHRGFKKPPRGDRERVIEKLSKVYISEADASAALDGYHDSDWGRENGWPINGYLKDPTSWIPSERKTVVELPPLPVVLPRPDPPAIAPVVPVDRPGSKENFDVWFERQYVRHPKKKNRSDAYRAVKVAFDNGLFEQDIFEWHHRAWCDTDEWSWKGGIKAPTLTEWIDDEGFRYLPEEWASSLKPMRLTQDNSPLGIAEREYFRTHKS